MACWWCKSRSGSGDTILGTVVVEWCGCLDEFESVVEVVFEDVVVVHGETWQHLGQL